MRTERAIEILNPEHREHYESIEPVNEACRMGMKALEKQIPKKLKKVTWIFKNKNDMRLATESDVLTEDNHITINHCPCCDEEATVVKYLSPPRYDLYCRKCGQALDWSDVE